jgi:hypothetical protein
MKTTEKWVGLFVHPSPHPESSPIFFTAVPNLVGDAAGWAIEPRASVDQPYLLTSYIRRTPSYIYKRK